MISITTGLRRKDSGKSCLDELTKFPYAWETNKIAAFLLSSVESESRTEHNVKPGSSSARQTDDTNDAVSVVKSNDNLEDIRTSEMFAEVMQNNSHRLYYELLVSVYGTVSHLIRFLAKKL